MLEFTGKFGANLGGYRRALKFQFRIRSLLHLCLYGFNPLNVFSDLIELFDALISNLDDLLRCALLCAPEHSLELTLVIAVIRLVYH